MVFSLYGMNFRYIPELDWRWGYPSLIGVLAFVCLWLFRRLKRAGWL